MPRLRRQHSSDGTRVAGHLTITTFRNGEVSRAIGTFPNKVVNSSGYGRNLIARQLVGDTTYGIEIDSVSIGDDDTPAADGQTDLLSPLETGIPITNAVAAGGTVTIDVFMTDASLPDDTYEEFGLFCGGRLFARIVIDPAYTKVTGEDTLFSYQLNLT